MVKFFCRITQGFYRATNVTCCGPCRIQMRRLLRIKAKMDVFSVFYVSMTECDICQRAVYRKILHTSITLI